RGRAGLDPQRRTTLNRLSYGVMAGLVPASDVLSVAVNVDVRDTSARLAQRKSTSLTWKGSVVRSHYRAPSHQYSAMIIGRAITRVPRHESSSEAILALGGQRSRAPRDVAHRSRAVLSGATGPFDRLGCGWRLA